MSDHASKPVRFAVAGLGNMGQRHLQILRATPGAQVTALLDHDIAKAQKYAQGETVYERFDDVLQDSSVDAVMLAVPSNHHAEMGICAAQAGKHVVVEKPIDSYVEGGEALTKACEDAGVQCAVISQHRFSDGFSAAKAALERGDLGKPCLARASVKWFRHDEYYTSSNWRGRVDGEGGGVLINQALHFCDLMLWLFGFPTDVQGYTFRSREVLETEDVAVASLRFPSGMLATLEATTTAFPGFEEGIEIHGQTASLIIERGRIKFWKHQDDRPEPAPPAWPEPEGGLDAKLALFQRQYRNIIGAIRGTEPLVVTPHQAVDAVRLVRMIYGLQKD